MFGGDNLKLSCVDIKLTGEDIKSIINDFIDINGLTFNNVNITDNIMIEGNFKSFISVPFNIKIKIKYVQDNIIAFNLLKVKVHKLRIFNFVSNFAVKMAVKDFRKYGIYTEKDEIKVDLKDIFKQYPFINLKLNNLELKYNMVMASIESINLDLSKFGEKAEEKEAEDKEDKEETIDINNISKVNDAYAKERDRLIKKMPDNVAKASDYIFVIPDIVCLIYRLLRDSRVSTKTKAIIVSTLTYVSLPTDIIPDKIPVIGKIDDISVIFFALSKVLEDVPLNIILENWQGKNELIIVVQKAVDYLIQYTGAESVGKIYSVIDQLTNK